MQSRCRTNCLVLTPLRKAARNLSPHRLSARSAGSMPCRNLPDFSQPRLYAVLSRLKKPFANSLWGTPTDKKQQAFQNRLRNPQFLSLNGSK